jgi:hypothetical protein
MKQRCTNPDAPGYHGEGGQGIRVCPAWSDSYTAFIQDLGAYPGKGHRVERIDLTKDYEPGNCRWAPIERQKTMFVQLQFKVGPDTATWIRQEGGSAFIRWVMETYRELDQECASLIVDRETVKKVRGRRTTMAAPPRRVAASG